MLNYIKQQTEELILKYHKDHIVIRRYLFDSDTYDLLKSKGITKINQYKVGVNVNGVKNTCSIVGDNIIATIGLAGYKI